MNLTRRETYARMVQQMDRQIGRILRALDAANNTVVVFTSDNGGERFSDTWPFTGKKMELLEGGLRIPAIVRWPGHVRPKTTTAHISRDRRRETGRGLSARRHKPGAHAHAKRRPGCEETILALQSKCSTRRSCGDMKWLEISGNTFLFNVATDPLERANLKNRLPDVHKKLVAEYADWEATMLPINPASNTGSFYGSEYADPYGNKRK